MSVYISRLNKAPCVRIWILILLMHVCAFYVLVLHDRLNVSTWSRCQAPRIREIIRVYGRNSTLVNLNKDKTRIVNKFLTEYDIRVRDRVDDVISNNVTARDPTLVSLVRDMMVPPSPHMIKPVRKITETPQSKEVLKILKGKRRGFFVEAGGLDGERSSNTLFLEQRRGWTGLLIEVDPFFYTQLLGKSRRCWSINACISPYSRPTELAFKESSGGAGQLVEPGSEVSLPTRTVPCFPLESMLLALNVSHVDYLSLDVEGLELDVLRTVPFHRLDVSVLSVEYVHGRAGKDQYRAYMEAQGYRTHMDMVHNDPAATMYVNDFIFVKE